MTAHPLWEVSPRFAKTSNRYSNLLSYKMLSSLPCCAWSILVQLCTGHISLSTFLKKIKASEMALCKHYKPLCRTLLETLHEACWAQAQAPNRKTKPFVLMSSQQPWGVHCARCYRHTTILQSEKHREDSEKCSLLTKAFSSRKTEDCL